MVDRSIRTRKALGYSILISEVKDMKSDVLRALKGFILYLTNYGQNVELWTFWVTMVTFTCVIL
jgi:hypothetical protein